MKSITRFLHIMVLTFFLFDTFGQCTISTSSNQSNGTFVANGILGMNCHGYVRTALLNNSVNMFTGALLSGASYDYNQFSISSDSRFVIVCDKDDAQAICFTHLSGQPDHSALVLEPGIITGASGSFASVAGSGSDVRSYGQASINSGYGTVFNYFALLPFVQGNDNVISYGSTKKFCIDSLPFIQSIKWTVSHPSIEIVGSDKNKCVDIKANCALGEGSFTISATLVIEGTGQVLSIHKTVIVTGCPNPCNTNLLGSGPLNTFNNISTGVTHEIKMTLGWTWKVNSGSPDIFQVLNGGKLVKLKISTGCVALKAYNQQCGERNFIFCPKFTPMIIPEFNESDLTTSSNLLESTEELSVFPNPVSSVLEIKTTPSSQYSVRIYNSMGKQLKEFKNQNQISVQEFDNGIYFLAIKFANSKHNALRKFVVLK